MALPRHRVAGRRTARLKRHRRLSVDREKTNRSSGALIRPARAGRVFNRLGLRDDYPRIHRRNLV